MARQLHLSAKITVCRYNELTDNEKILPFLRRILDTAHGLLLLLFLVRRSSCELALPVYSFCAGGAYKKLARAN